MSKKKIMVFILGLIVIGFIIYWYPVQKSFAKGAVEEYMVKQKISKENVKTKDIMKDYKQGGYIINVELKDDPGIIYEYTWSKNRGVILIVYKDNSGMGDKGMKYPPLD